MGRPKKQETLEREKLIADIAKIKATTQNTLIRTATLQDQIIIRDDALDILNHALATLNESLTTLPTRLAKQLSGEDLTALEMQTIIEETINDIKQQLLDDLEAIKNGL